MAALSPEKFKIIGYKKKKPTELTVLPFLTGRTHGEDCGKIPLPWLL